MDRLSITPMGLEALQDFQKRQENEAEAKRQQRFQNQISIAQALIPLVTFVLGLVVEHYSGLVSGLAEFFGRWIK